MSFNVLSLFDGKSTGLAAFKSLGIPVNNYYASEINYHPMVISEKNHPEVVHLSRVQNYLTWDIPWANIDIILAGSPCQGFSSSGKGRGFEDNRSKLYYYLIDILAHARRFNPDVDFLLENVKMKKVWLDIIDQDLGVKGQFINSNVFTPQSRQRYYWTSWTIGQPAYQRTMNLCDVITSGYVDRYESYCIDANYHKGSNFSNYFDKSRRQIVFDSHEDYVARSDNWRILSPVECEILQGLEPGYTEGVSNTQRYKMIGNGWNLPTIVHILKCKYGDRNGI